MRYESTATCLSWIPPAAVEETFKLPFGMGVAHYDQPPQAELPDVEALLAEDAIGSPGARATHRLRCN